MTALDGYLDMDLLRFLTAGSVDDGKSTLIGRLLYDSKTIFEDQLEAVAEASRRRGQDAQGVPNLALLTDGLRAEREQGITIDVAYRFFATPRRKFIVADTPGHVEYTRNMVTGASTADLAVLLVDAERGVQSQTRRHAFIASLLGIAHVVVAVNKMDLVGYDEAIFEAIVDEFTGFAGKLDLRDLDFIPVSALAGDNVVERSTEMPWYQGPTLLHHLEHVPVAGDRNHRDFRFPVQTVLRADGFRGYAGTVASGAIRPGETVLALPVGRETIVDAVSTLGGEHDEARVGEAVVLTLTDDVDLGRGGMLVRPGNVPAVGTEIDAMMCWMNANPLDPTRTYLVRHTAQEVQAQVTAVAYRVDVNSLHRVDADGLGLNEIGRVQLSTAAPLFFDAYAANKPTGAFVLVDPQTNGTVAAGMIRGEAADPSRPEPRAISPNVVWDMGGVTREEREERQGHSAAVVWLTGLSGSGKSTIARGVERELFDAGVRAVRLDGDNVRHGLSGDLGFSPSDRAENVRRVGHVARLFFDAGHVVLCALVSPSASDRDGVRGMVPEGRFFEVLVDVDLDTARERDPKGLYRRADSGEIKDLTGVSAPFDRPENPHLVLDTAGIDEAAAVESVLAMLRGAGLVGMRA